MMPDLGKYAFWVLSAYGVSLSLLAALVLVSILQARRALRELREIEEGRRKTAARPPAPAPQDAVQEGSHG